jgi:hypothetical protein
MGFINKNSIKLYTVAVILIILAGIGIFITAFLAADIRLQVALGSGGIGLISLGLVIIKLIRDTRAVQEKLDTIIAGLEELRQEIQKKEKPEKSGIAIADIISSGLKFYSEYKDREKKEE